MPWSEGNSPLEAGSSYEDYVLAQWRHGAFDEYWAVPGLYNEAAYDAALGGRQLIMGPWLHGDRTQTHSGDLEFGDAARFDGNVAASWLEYRLDWFESILVRGEQPAARVRVFEMGGGIGNHGGRWVELESWPPADVAPVSLRFADGGKLQGLSADSASESAADSAAAGAELGVVAGAGDDAGTVELVADPARPVPMVGGQATSGKPIFVGGGFDQVEDARFFGAAGDGTPLIDRDDVLFFETDPLDHDVVVAGPVTVDVALIADEPDFDIAAKLVDVYPDGQAYNITDSILRARYRRSFAEPGTYPRSCTSSVVRRSAVGRSPMGRGIMPMET